LSDHLSTVLQTNSYLVKEILNYIGDKNIYILGDMLDLSDVIINAPVLVRINGNNTWGKCDIWFSDDEHLEYSTYPQKYIIRSPKDGNASLILKNYPSGLENRTLFLGADFWAQMLLETKIEYPLTETVAAYWFLKNTSSNITLLNYNFSNKHTDYATGKVIYLDDKHNPELDKEYLSSQPRISLKRVVL